MDAYSQRMLDLLEDQDPIHVLEQTPYQLAAFFERFGEADWLRSYAPEKWDARHIFAHLADTELGIGFRLRQMVAGVRELQPFDQDAWAAPYPRLDPALALDAFRAQRAWNLARYASFSLEDWLSEADHPERGQISVDLSVRVSAGHDLNHLQQLARIAQG